MPRKLTFLLAALAFLVAAPASACGNHFYFDPDDAGFFGRALIKVAGLAPPEKVFRVEHVPAIAVPMDEESNVTLDYKRPWFSEQVQIKLTASKNIELLDSVFELDDFSGRVMPRFRLKGAGMNMITVTVSGKHRGEFHRYQTGLYVRAASR